jgi:RimJ/RimL family protein N-acetyltransferase
VSLEARTICMRLVDVSDSEFILKLRLDKTYNLFLSQVSPNLEAQKNWIQEYKKEEKEKKQYYFIIERLDGTPCGTVRIYDLRKESFSWGSWILNEDKTRYAAIESALLVYEFGFEMLGYCKSNFEVMKENSAVLSFHKKMGALEIGEDEDNIYLSIEKNSVHSFKKRMEKIL